MHRVEVHGGSAYHIWAAGGCAPHLRSIRERASAGAPSRRQANVLLHGGGRHWTDVRRLRLPVDRRQPELVQPVAVTSSALRTPLSHAIFVRLRDGILGGRPAAGGPLPSERVLAEELGCNRHAIREAVKRLQQAGLVAVSHGGATRVLDWRVTGGLDLLGQIAFSDGAAPDPVLLRSILELRLCVGVDAARRCAQRAPAPAGAALHAALEAQRDAPAGEQPLRYAALWNEVVDGAGNIAYRLAYNSLLAGLEPDSELSRALFGAEAADIGAVAALVAAIAEHDVARAGAAADDLLRRALALAPAPPTAPQETAGG
jgi:DNA-binding FadR family transcriptional regulator